MHRKEQELLVGTNMSKAVLHIGSNQNKKDPAPTRGCKADHDVSNTIMHKTRSVT